MRKPEESSKFSLKASSVMLSPILNTPSERPSHRSTLYMHSSAKGALSTVSAARLCYGLRALFGSDYFGNEPVCGV